MIPIIDEYKKPSGAQRFANAIMGAGQAAGQAIPQYMQQKQQQQERNLENSQLEKIFGEGFANITDPKMRQLFAEYNLKGKNDLERLSLELQGKKDIESMKNKGDSSEKISPIVSALDVVNRMREVRKKGKLGVASGFLGVFDDETRKDRGEYSQLGKSLISFATTIPIRNKLEFETLAERLYDPSITDAEAEGILNAMERILNNSLSEFQHSGQEYQQQNEMQNQIQAGAKSNRPPIESSWKKR